MGRDRHGWPRVDGLRRADEGEARAPGPAVPAGGRDSRRGADARRPEFASVPHAEWDDDIRVDAAQNAPAASDRGRSARRIRLPGAGLIFSSGNGRKWTEPSGKLLHDEVVPAQICRHRGVGLCGCEEAGNKGHEGRLAGRRTCAEHVAVESAHGRLAVPLSPRQLVGASSAATVGPAGSLAGRWVWRLPRRTPVPHGGARPRGSRRWRRRHEGHAAGTDAANSGELPGGVPAAGGETHGSRARAAAGRRGLSAGRGRAGGREADEQFPRRPASGGRRQRKRFGHDGFGGRTASS